jgi:hypothetical protein
MALRFKIAVHGRLIVALKAKGCCQILQIRKKENKPEYSVTARQAWTSRKRESKKLTNSHSLCFLVNSSANLAQIPRGSTC